MNYGSTSKTMPLSDDNLKAAIETFLRSMSAIDDKDPVKNLKLDMNFTTGVHQVTVNFNREQEVAPTTNG